MVGEVWLWQLLEGEVVEYEKCDDFVVGDDCAGYVVVYIGGCEVVEVVEGGAIVVD